ncbi:CHAT domain-containing protein [Streptomyces bambusae]|uniref:CHAT domain-containing protein n=1 Tax=Streptomyces bambusae TaxID=1550616 RepID=UPI001CFDAE95|nr:CHAT domain-containing protein [Streptomyces bambusae]MCB5167761.1 CHAT domain-containing protein [Streptomyces bambusae]
MVEGTGWAEADRLSAALEERLEAFWMRGDAAAVTDPAAVAEATGLRLLVLRSPLPAAGAEPDRDALYLLDLAALYRAACLHFARCLVLGPGSEQAQPDAELTFALFSFVGRFAPEEVPEQIREHVAAVDLPVPRDVAALVADGLELLARWTAVGDPAALEASADRWRELLDVLPEGHPAVATMLSNLSFALRSRYLVHGRDADLEEAAEAGRAAVRLARPDDPERALYLTNLSGALTARFGLRRLRADLDEAVEAGRESVRAAPEPQALLHSNTGLALLLRYEQDADPADLAEAVEALRRAAGLAAPDDPQRASYLSNLGQAYDQRFLLSGDPADLDGAVDAAIRSVVACPPGHPARPGLQASLGNVLRSKARHTGAAADLDAAVDAVRRALAAMTAGSPARPVLLRSLGDALKLRFEHGWVAADIDEAVGVLRERLDLCTRRGDDADTAVAAYDLGHALLSRHRHTADPADADAAVAAARLSVRVRAGAAGSDRGVPLCLLGEALSARHRLTGAAADNEEAVAALTEACALLAGYHPAARAKCHSELGHALAHRFERTDEPADVDAALAAYRTAVEVGPDRSEIAVDASHVGGQYLRRFGRTGNADDLAQALDWHRRAARSLRGDRDRHAPQVLLNLGRALQTAYEQSGETALLDEAVQRMEAAVPAGGPQGPADAVGLSSLGALLTRRAERSGVPADLDRAVGLTRRAAAALPEGHPERAVHLTNLSSSLLARYKRTGARADVEEAVRVCRQAVEIASRTDRAQLAVPLTNLGSALLRRYEASGARPDLEEAVEANRAAVRAVPAGSADGPTYRNNLCITLLGLAERTGEARWLDEAVAAGREALAAEPAGHPLRPTLLSNLAMALLGRHRRGRDRADREEALTHLRAAVAGLPEAHPLRAKYLANLSRALRDRFTVEHLPQDPGDLLDAVPQLVLGRGARRRFAGAYPDLVEAIGAAEESVRLTPVDDLQRAAHVSQLAWLLVVRAVLGRSRSALRRAFGYYREATELATAPVKIRFRAARAWGVAALGTEQWGQALDAHRAAVAELPLLAWHGLDRADRLDALGRAAGVAGDAAAVALTAGRPEEALQLLEQGRGVLLAQALEARDDLSRLREQAPALAARMGEVRALLDAAEDPGAELPGDPAAAERRRDLATEMDALLAEARALPGLSDFLRPPDPRRLLSAAAGGPVVVVNTSALRCDALIVTRAGLRTVPLPDLRLEGPGGVTERAAALLDALAAAGGSPTAAWRAQRVLTGTLGWLWDAVAAPVVAELASVAGPPSDPSVPPRLWWCPTGLLSLLPLHAAGHYGPGGGDAGPGPSLPGPRNLPDRYVCSYTTTLRALVAARSGGTAGPRSGAPGTGGRLLAVDASHSPGLPVLPHAREEAGRVAGRVPGATLLAGEGASRRAVLDALPDHGFLHFSGHGSQDPADSAGGALYCHDHAGAGPLTASDIARLRLSGARLAFLSACETARGSAGLPDEAVHLAGALQLAGFGHVVAAQWVVGDASALRAVAEFYEGLALPGAAGLDADRAARALHAAVQGLREAGEHPLWWAAYVHTGP